MRHEEVILTPEGAAVFAAGMDPLSPVAKPVAHVRRLLPLAREAVAAQRALAGEDVEEWARRLAADVSGAND